MRIIAEQLGVSANSLEEETAFADIGADSLDMFQIISALEEAFDLEFDHDAAEGIATIGDVTDYIRKAMEN
ncbi:MAG TPA: acyl carrier protein [Candidatus Anaerotignum merdipullorum]|nr:acyl carrier protein [Candidatus Anaerotignum merdipullorum]